MLKALFLYLIFEQKPVKFDLEVGINESAEKKKKSCAKIFDMFKNADEIQQLK